MKKGKHLLQGIRIEKGDNNEEKIEVDPGCLSWDTTGLFVEGGISDDMQQNKR